MVDKDGKFFINIDNKWYENIRLGCIFTEKGGQVINVNMNEYQHCEKVYEPHRYK